MQRVVVKKTTMSEAQMNDNHKGENDYLLNKAKEMLMSKPECEGDHERCTLLNHGRCPLIESMMRSYKTIAKM